MTTPKKQQQPPVPTKSGEKAAQPGPAPSKAKSQKSPGPAKSIGIVKKRTAVPLASAGHNDRRTLKKLRMVEEYDNLSSESEPESN